MYVFNIEYVFHQFARSPQEMELPVLDCSLLEQGPEAEARFAAALGTALEQVGFFFLVNHGVDAALVDSVFAQTATFHALPVGRGGA